MTHSRKIWAKPIRQNKYERIYDGLRIIAKSAISNRWRYVTIISIQDSDTLLYGFSKSAHNAAIWKPKTLKRADIGSHEVHSICRKTSYELKKITLEQEKSKSQRQNWNNPVSCLPKIGEKIIVKRENEEHGQWEEVSAWGGSLFLCDLYGDSKVIKWRKKTAFD